jgi:phosphopantothenoylcysteine decarboxylase/phosphopantothenate--cysteine ligase
MLNFSNKNILLCVTGGIAAYKAAEIIRLFKKDGGDVRVIMTESAKEFITPLTLQAVSGNEIHDSLLDLKAESAMGHIELAKWADIILIAPCTAESMAKIVHGRADDLMGAVILASKASTYIAPAMNTTMWLDQGTQANYQTLLSRGIDFIGPDEGEQACGDIGPGRLVEPDKIINLIKSHSNRGPLSGKTVTITAGPTREQIDPVRYISNNSSGKMGYALAEAAVQEGAIVNLVSGPVMLAADKSINLFKINSASEMLEAVNVCMKSQISLYHVQLLQIISLQIIQILKLKKKIQIILRSILKKIMIFYLRLLNNFLPHISWGLLLKHQMLIQTQRRS